jgi:hypothetical protein
MFLNFLVHEDTFLGIFSSKKFSAKSWGKIYEGQDPDPDVFKSRNPDPLKNRPDPQHCLILKVLSFRIPDPTYR